MKKYALFFLLTSFLCAQDLQVIHLPPDAAQTLQQAYQRKQEATEVYDQLERLAIMSYATRPGGGNAGNAMIVTRDPLPGWQFGAVFTLDFAAMIPRPEPKKPACGALSALESNVTASRDVDTIPAIPYLR